MLFTGARLAFYVKIIGTKFWYLHFIRTTIGYFQNGYFSISRSKLYNSTFYWPSWFVRGRRHWSKINHDYATETFFPQEDIQNRICSSLNFFYRFACII